MLTDKTMGLLDEIQNNLCSTIGWVFPLYVSFDNDTDSCRGDCSGECEGDCSGSCEGDCAWGCSDGCTNDGF